MRCWLARRAFEGQTRADLRFNFAGSNLLALQIEAAPRADVYLSANERWMDYLDQRNLLAAGTRRTLLSNRLVMVAQRASPFRLQEAGDLADLPFRFLALADPDGVPAGRYAREYLKGLPRGAGSVWEAVVPRVAPAPDVRAALAMVEADPRVVGIVYRTDAAASPRVRVLLEVPPEEGPLIRYQAAAIRSSPRPALARTYLDFLGQAAARREFESHGFRILPQGDDTAGRQAGDPGSG